MVEREKRDIHNVKRQFQSAVTRLEVDRNLLPRNRELIIDFIRDCRLGKTVKKREKKIIGEGRCLRYISQLRRLSRWLNKPFDDVIQKDMEALIEGLENDQFMAWDTRARTQRNLAQSTKVGYKKALRKFYKWLMGNGVSHPDLVDWIDTYDPPTEIPALRRREVEHIADACNIRDKAIIMCLFDSGARTEEFLNIRICDITKTEDSFKVRIVHSKTKPRTIHLPISSKWLELWLNQHQSSSEQEFLFPITYETLRMMLHRVAKRVLGKRVTPHILRHSSVTYYANLLNHHQLCYRYGWSMASDMPNRYIDREGILEEETRHLVKANDLAGLEKQNVVLKEEMTLVKASNEQISDELSKLGRKYDDFFEGKDFMELLASLAKKQKEMSRALKQITGKKFDIVMPK